MIPHYQLPDIMKLSIDLGGTNIRAAIVDGDKCLKKLSQPCKANEKADVIINQIISLAESLLIPEIDGIGVGVPSVVDSQKGIVFNACNIPSWRKVYLGDILFNHFGLPVRVNNDCNCFALGEHKYGAGKNLDNIVAITLGTGVGAGIVIGGKLYSGILCGAGEIGSLPYLDSDYEHYCSSLWFSGIKHTTGYDLARLAAKGNKKALATWNEFGNHLGELIKAILFTYAPDAVIIGGEIAESMHLFRQGIEESLSTFPYLRIADSCKILKSSLPDASLIGASLLF